MAVRTGLKKLASRVADRALGRQERRPEPTRPAAPPPPPLPVERPPTPALLAEPPAELCEEDQAIHRGVVAALRQVFDPEIPLNIFDLGLIYGLEVRPGGRVVVKLTLTSPACPMGPMILDDARRAVQETEGVVYPRVDLVWDPPWDPQMLPEETRLELGIY
ncbi:MAG: iron-sulfur cluster assembly protein [Pseudomonadota bacterium]